MSQRSSDDVESIGVLQLSAHLKGLKGRTGRSYEALAGRVGASKSALHRYCTGTIVPAEFRPLEQFAEACGASRGEVHELYRLWIIADAERDKRRAVDKDQPAPVRKLARWMHVVFRRTRT